MKTPVPSIRFLLLGCLALLLAGCASAGKDFDVLGVRQIQLHQTTRSQVEALFGPPWRTGIEDGKQTWSYGYYKYGLGDTLSRDLTIRFDATGTVTSYTFTSSYPEDKGL
ncbi:MAG: outer membrane protein assembly factor BamE [Desulfobulbus sp.]|jgi:hypothetical protein|uniref:outer membrane protein assembly factor BamE domain-containing protein n=1 Tax=Desulfobulbus sp. TaxID=895 RepID=UPI002851FC31|nr:outer membrane protein assembly factor BamE [Desulfobulbus sp.]MDR2551158.1 outer membrane protein assembly factor BamE [Desulfobulbus sp.]